MITIISQPQRYSPLNLALFKVTSNNNVLMFRVTIFDSDTSLIISVQKYATLPMLLNGTIFDLSAVLSAFVDSLIVNTDALLAPVDTLSKAYNIVITELYRNDAGDIAEGDTLDNGNVFYIWNGTLSRPGFHAFMYDNFVAKSGIDYTKFLNNRPLTSKLYYSSLQFLYFMTSLPVKVEIIFYKRGFGAIGTHVVTLDTTADNAYRLNVSPLALEAYFGADLFNGAGGEFTDEFTAPFGTEATVGAVSYYTVRLLDSSGSQLTERRIYEIATPSCAKELVDVLFVNNLGGVDTVTLSDPRKTVTSTKTTIDSNPYQIDQAGDYSDIKGGVYNQTSAVIGSSNNNSFSLISDPLSDELSAYMESLVESDKVFVRLSSGDLMPVELINQDYLVNKIRYKTDNARFTLSFKVTDINFNL